MIFRGVFSERSSFYPCKPSQNHPRPFSFYKTMEDKPHAELPHSHGASDNIRVSFFLNLAFTVVEIIGGLYTNSMAILSDALHDLGDSLSLGMAWYLERVSNKKPNASFTYGFKRFSTLSALINANVLVVGSLIILYHAIPRLFNPEPVNAGGVFVLALLGVVFNGLAVLRLKKGSSLNERVVMLHLLEDVLGWVAILIGSVIMWFWDVPWLDPLLSIAIALFVLRNAVKNLRQTLRIFLQAVPNQYSLQVVTNLIMSVPEVKGVHNVNLWSLDGEYQVLTAHVVVSPDVSLQESEEIKEACRKIVKNEKIQHITLEIETNEGECEVPNFTR